MSITKKQFAEYVKHFNFRELFNDMGWNNDKTDQPVVVDNQTFHLKGIAEKSGFKILLCSPTDKGIIPDYNTRRMIDTKVTKLFQEHLIIYCDNKKQEQIWQLVVRQSGKPAKISETRYHISQDAELLYQRASGIFFEMDEEEKITIVDVTRRIKENFHQNNEKVTKKFYERFKKEHTSFLSFINGIDSKVNRDWYASLMLNRLMFCYFIQKKGFLDKNKNYLRDKLKACQAKKGKDKFYSFYRDFLLVLFHEGLNEPKQKKNTVDEIGKIPYLNGGLFDEHELEKSFTINIDDKAFERVFDFFDEYEWHLDTRKAATGKDINPDVIGYIFEKYINDRAQMGAYYTKEDITDYISKNCIIPWLFDETARNHSKTFAVNEEIPAFLISSGDTYIYNAVKHGASEPLPKDIQAGIKDVLKRTHWNTPATPELGLPTEIWRETVERRKRYEEVKKKIKDGEIQSINDFITYNLNIRQFAQDVIVQTNDAEFLKAFYKALNKVTILDPTCGSGAFLFAAMNILEPLYHACITRMRAFTEDEDRHNEEKRKTFSNKYKFFREVLGNIQNEKHPNLEYFIYKSIILNNLYGVDIMKEAVEIAKLRLFLKLVATVEADYRKPNLGLEPLPDIDFNIRSGNTLIGFATEAELQRGLTYTLDGLAAKPAIEEKCEIVANAFKRYKEIQLSYGDDHSGFKNAKKELNKRLYELNTELNKLLHKQADGIKYDLWLQNYQPFHWFAEFYEIIHDGKGFDVIIGNPPYVEYSKVGYKLKNFSTIKCGNLYAFIVERYFLLLKSIGKSGMIVPHSSICTDRMEPLIKVLKKANVWLSTYDIRPSKLFDGADQRLLIYVTSFSNFDKKEQITSNYHRWSAEFRTFLFQNIEYVKGANSIVPNSLIKASKKIEKSIIKKISAEKILAEQFESSTPIFFHNAPRYFIRVMNKVPYFWSEKDGEKASTQVKSISFGKENKTFAVGSVLNSNLFYWWFVIFSDSRHLNNREIEFFPFSIAKDETKNSLLVQLFNQLNNDFETNKIRKSACYKATGEIEYDEYYPKLSKPIIDEIDKVLAQHYGFTDEELDFIINYDIKYRMGKELEGEE